MKWTTFVLIFLAFFFNSIGQPVSPIPGGAGKIVFTAAGGTATNFLVDPEWRVTTLQAGAVWGQYGSIQGSAFYKEEWHKGYIILKGNRLIKDISLSYNIYENQIYYLQDSQALVLDASIPVEEFGLYDHKEDTNHLTIFRCGYPSTGRNNEKTFYQVIANDRIQLLKHYGKSIIESVNLASAPDKSFFDSETWFVYNASENKLTAIKKNKSSLEDALPQYTNLIQSIIQQNNFKLKTENEWASLFDELNKQAK